MKIKVKGLRYIAITGEYIRLDALLKLADVVSTGGEAKIYIQNGEVFVNGETVTQRGKKVRPGDIVRYGGRVLAVKKADDG